MNVESKEFWLKVKEEYKPDLSHLICYTSNEFRIKWEREVSYNFIAQEALKFLKDDRFEVALHVLFFCPHAPKEEKIQVRKDFIDHMINKFS